MWSLTDRRRNGDETQTRNCEKQASDIYREETVLQSDSYGDINVFIDVASDCLLTSGDINGRGIIEELLRLYNYYEFSLYTTFIIQLIKSKCIPALLYGLEACPLHLIHDL